MNRETLIEILKLAVRAPSGDNSQPWKFRWDGATLAVFGIEGRDNPIFNYEHRGTYIALGALIENIIIASPHSGFQPNLVTFPNPTDKFHVADLNFVQVYRDDNQLFSAINERVVNRKPYKLDPLPREFIADLTKSISEFKELNLTLTEDREKIDQLGQAVSANEIVMLENKGLHDLFYDSVRWNEKEEKIHKTGLYAKTMELLPPQLAIFRLLKNWSIARILTGLGLAKFIAKENARGYAQTPLFGVITVKNNEPLSYIDAGRALQRIWLKATRDKLGLQPIIGIIYLGMSISAGKDTGLSVQHAELVSKSCQKIEQVLGTSDQIAVMFRLGDGGQASGRSSRLDPEVKF